MQKKYVTAFTGRRDSYQIPVGLSEAGRLAAFATCFYRSRGVAGRLGESFQSWRKLGLHRHAEGLEAAKVECLELTNLASRLGQRILQPSKVAVWEDDAFARKAVMLARRHRASLLLYEFQADWAFRQSLDRNAVRILFQFHPHPDLEHPLLWADGLRYPQYQAGIRRNTRANLSQRYREHTRAAWRLADHVIVASGFTARSLRTAGCPAEKISVVPYGCSFKARDAETTVSPPPAKPYFLFVGSGTQRKGLHHLLEAWKNCVAAQTHELVVIARTVEPELQVMLADAGTGTVRHIAGVSGNDLPGWFAGARAFILPSLSEGFGHVYLEALACGCPVIGTRNSMLPDFADAQPHIRYVEPGEPASIQQVIDAVAALPVADVFFDAHRVRASIAAYTWKNFREGLESVLRRFD